MTKELKRVVITGMGAITPLGNSVDEFWGNIVLGKSGVGLITKFDTTNFKTKFAAEIKGFVATEHFEKNEARKYDLFTQYAVAAANEAIKNARLDFEKLNRNKIGVIWGSGNGGMLTMQNEVEGFFKGDKVPRFNPHFISKIIADIPSGVISIRHGLRGLNFLLFLPAPLPTLLLLMHLIIYAGAKQILLSPAVQKRLSVRVVLAGLMHHMPYLPIMKIPNRPVCLLM
jgi:3-oxoacyl-[acyl-carrier-protein] synthase II